MYENMKKGKKSTENSLHYTWFNFTLNPGKDKSLHDQ